MDKPNTHFLQSWKTKLLRTAIESGLDGNKFEIKEATRPIFGNPYLLVTYDNSAYHYSVMDNALETHIYYCPSKTKAGELEILKVASPNLETHILPSFNFWLKNLKSELDSADEFTNLLNQKWNFTVGISHEHFTEEEQIEMLERISLLEERIDKMNLLPEQNEIIINQLKELRTAVKLLSKAGWYSFMIGIVATIVITGTLDVVRGKEIFEYMKTIFIVKFQLGV